MPKAILTAETTRIVNDGEAVFEITCPLRGKISLHINIGSPNLRIEDDAVEPPRTVEPPSGGAEKIAEAGARGSVPDASWSREDLMQFMVVNDIATPHVITGTPSKPRLLTAIREHFEKASGETKG